MQKFPLGKYLAVNVSSGHLAFWLSILNTSREILIGLRVRRYLNSCSVERLRTIVTLQMGRPTHGPGSVSQLHGHSCLANLIGCSVGHHSICGYHGFNSSVYLL